MRIITCPANMIDLQLASGEDYIEGTVDDDSLVYIVNGSIQNRPYQQTTLSNTLVIANGIDYVVLQSLPITCAVSVKETAYNVTDGVLEVSFDTVGTYRITITAFPYLDKTFTVEAI